jgi:hypothetical protein
MLQPPPHQLKLKLKYNIDRYGNRTAMSNAYPPANGSITRITLYSSLRLSYGNAQLFYKCHVTWIRVNVWKYCYSVHFCFFGFWWLFFMLPQLAECIFDGLYMTAVGSLPKLQPLWPRFQNEKSKLQQLCQTIKKHCYNNANSECRKLCI